MTSTTSVAGYGQADLDRAVGEGHRGFRVHAMIYGVVVTGLVVLNVVLVTSTDASFWWFPFPLLGWGIGVGNHYYWGVHRLDADARARQAELTGATGGRHAATT